MKDLSKFIINGKNKLYGKIEVESSKNAILPLLAGSIMCNGKVTINKVTFYEDVVNMIEILTYLGVKVIKNTNSLEIDASTISKFEIPQELSSKLRASIFFLGPLLSRLKKARVAYPGGCCIGARPIDIHINGLKKMGAGVLDRHGIITLNADNLKPCHLCLPFPSVGATENLIMASVFLQGVTTISGVAKEPEIIDLCNFLNKAGAKIYGAGSDTIVISGVKQLNGVEYEPMPDRIIAGTYVFLPLICGGEVEICNVNLSHISPILELVLNNTCKTNILNDRIIIRSNGVTDGFGKIETMPYPFFPTDLAQPLSAVASVCKGNTILIENLFENRFKHIPELVKMGANIVVKDRTAIIEGVENLYGATVTATDLRGGIALVLAGLSASGYTTVLNANVIDRGYYKIEDKLTSLGASIFRENY